MRPIIGITMGDPAGVGAEIAVKALAHPEIYDRCIPVVVGDYEAIYDANVFSGTGLEIHTISDPTQAVGEAGTLELMDLHCLAPGSWEYKKVSALCGEAAFQYVKAGIQLAQAKKIHAVVTGPINKESIHMAGHKYSGHTEIFMELTGAEHSAMLLMGGGLRVIHVTTHVSMREACDRITEQRVLEVIRLGNNAMRQLGIQDPRIGVSGFNAHCSENGLFGTEEAAAIIPAIQTARREQIDAHGPVPPDTVFVKARAGQYDLVVAMYHDQGHIPLKLAGFKLDLNTNQYTSMSGVNCTVGLPIIRTSVDHGTAFGKAGEGRANEESLTEAIDVGVKMAAAKFGF